MNGHSNRACEGFRNNLHNHYRTNLRRFTNTRRTHHACLVSALTCQKSTNLAVSNESAPLLSECTGSHRCSCGGTMYIKAMKSVLGTFISAWIDIGEGEGGEGMWWLFASRRGGDTAPF